MPGDGNVLNPGATPLDNVIDQLGNLMTAYNNLAAENNRPRETDIPRSMFLEIDPWDPDDTQAVSVTTFFRIFEDVAGTLPADKQLRLLKAKVKGSAKHFLLDNPHLMEGTNPVRAVRTAMQEWFDKECPEKAAAALWSIKRSSQETLRQFAETLRRLAQSAVRAEGITFSQEQKRAWVANHVKRAFIKGVGKELGSHLQTSNPATIEEALKRAEALEETLGTRDEPDSQWDLAAVAIDGERRCYNCGVAGHFAARCPRPKSGTSENAQKPMNRPAPRYPCMFCANLKHFPVDCPYNPQKAIFCDYCRVREHLEANCLKKKSRPRVKPTFCKARSHRRSIEGIGQGTPSSERLVYPNGGQCHGTNAPGRCKTEWRTPISSY